MFRAILLLQRERLKEMWSNKVAKTKKKHTSIDFFHLRFFTIYNIQNSLKNIKGPIKGMFRAILLLQRERLKEMWSNKVAKTKKKHTSIDFFHLRFFTIFYDDTTSKIVSKT